MSGRSDARTYELKVAHMAGLAAGRYAARADGTRQMGAYTARGKERGLRIEVDCQGWPLPGRKKNPCDRVQILCELFW